MSQKTNKAWILDLHQQQIEQWILEQELYTFFVDGVAKGNPGAYSERGALSASHGDYGSKQTAWQKPRQFSHARLF